MYIAAIFLYKGKQNILFRYDQTQTIFITHHRVNNFFSTFHKGTMILHLCYSTSNLHMLTIYLCKSFEYQDRQQ